MYFLYAFNFTFFKKNYLKNKHFTLNDKTSVQNSVAEMILPQARELPWLGEGPRGAAAAVSRVVEEETGC